MWLFWKNLYQNIQRNIKLDSNLKSTLSCKFIDIIIIIKTAHVITASRNTQTVVRMETRGWLHSADTLWRSVCSARK